MVSGEGTEPEINGPLVGSSPPAPLGGVDGRTGAVPNVSRLARRERWLLASILVVAGCLRLAWALYATRTPNSPMSGDSFFYQFYGRALAEGAGYDNYSTGEPTAYYPIGYPATLAGLFWVVRHTPLPDDLPMAISLFQAVLGTASVGLIFVIARRLFDVGTALISSALLAVFPNVIFYTATAQLETVFTFAFLAAVVVAVHHDWLAGPPSRLRMVAFGALLGVSALIRPFSLPLLAGLAVTFLVGGFGWRRTASGVGWASLALALVVAPWLTRNAVVMHAPVFSTNMGDTVCIDRYVHSTGRFRFVDSPRCAPSSTPEAERSAENLRIALKFVREHPADELGLVGKRFWFMMERDSDGLDFERSQPFFGHRVRTSLNLVANAYFFALLPPALVGLVLLGRKPRPDRILVIAAIVSLLGIPLVLWGNVRFHFPLLPFIAMAAAVPLGRIARFRRADGDRRHRPRRRMRSRIQRAATPSVHWIFLPSSRPRAR